MNTATCCYAMDRMLGFHSPDCESCVVCEAPNAPEWDALGEKVRMCDRCATEAQPPPTEPTP